MQRGRALNLTSSGLLPCRPLDGEVCWKLGGVQRGRDLNLTLLGLLPSRRLDGDVCWNLGGPRSRNFQALPSGRSLGSCVAGGRICTAVSASSLDEDV